MSKMIQMWDDRYSSSRYAYGTNPNEFFKNTLTEYALNGNILFPAEGEGRNAVFAAKRATAVMGATLGGWGSKRINTATKTKLIKTFSFLLKDI